MQWYTLLLALMGAVGLWLVDVSVIHWLNPQLGPPGNGFFTVAAVKLYHIALYLTFLCLVLLAAPRN